MAVYTEKKTYHTKAHMGMIDVTEDFQHAVEEACRQHGISAGTVTGFTTGDSVRGLRNAFSDKYLKAEYSGAPLEELISLATGTTRKGAVDGDTDNGFVLAGMSLTHLTKIQPVEEIVEELVSETERRLAGAPGLIK